MQRQPDDSLFLHRYWSVKKKRQLVSKKCFKKNNVINDEATLLIRELESTWYIPGRSDTYILRASLTKIDNHDGHEMWFHMCEPHSSYNITRYLVIRCEVLCYYNLIAVIIHRAPKCTSNGASCVRSIFVWFHILSKLTHVFQQFLSFVLMCFFLLTFFHIFFLLLDISQVLSGRKSRLLTFSSI